MGDNEMIRDMNKEIGILFVYGPQGKSAHILNKEDIPQTAKYSSFGDYYSLTHV